MGVTQEVSAGRLARPLLAAWDPLPHPGKRFQNWSEFLESRWVVKAIAPVSLRKTNVLASY